MKKFTFIAEYKGGTFISQHKATDLKTAVFSWIDNLQVKEFKEEEKGIIREKFSDEDFFPHPLNEVDNVWCGAISAKRHFLLVNIVETV